MNNPLVLNQKLLLTIKRIGINGEGIGYYKRLAVFIPNSLVGEEVEVQITKLEDKYAYGEVIKFKKISPHRVSPRCPFYGKCGGCQLQHLDYQEQLVQKRNIVVEAFERYYNGDVEKIKIYDTVGMANPWNYRNKTQLPTRHDGESVVVGIYALDSNKLVFIDECLIENELITQAMKEILAYLTKANIDVYNPRYKQGSLRYIVLRGLEATNEIQATFVLFKNDKRLIKALEGIITIANIKSVSYTINSDPKAIEIINGKIELVAGKDKIAGKLGDLDFDISPDSFLQLNSEQTIKLYDLVVQAMKPDGTENVLDCYCGIGSIGLYAAKYVKELRGIDNNRANIENAKEFAKKNNIENAKFYFGDILPHLHNFEKEGYNIDTLIIDPPRKGMELNIINYLQKSKIKKIIYVSCNPSTLVKNLNHLQKAYDIRFVKPVDMFPHTANVETVVLLSRKKW